MRVLWGASSQPGSLFPAVPIVAELVRRGHHVTALSDAPSEASFRALGCDFLPETRTDEVPPPVRPLTRETKSVWFAARSAALHADATQALSAGSFDVVLADPLEIGIDFAAESMGVPCCSYVHWGLDERGPDVPFSFHLWDHETPIDLAFAGWWNALRADVDLPAEPRPASEHRWYRTSAQLTLILGLPALVHPHGTLPPNTVRVGPTVWEPRALEPLPEWIPSIGTTRPALLASVSTIGSAKDLDVVEHLAAAAAALDVEVVLTIPIDHDLPPLPGHVRVAPFLPHSTVLDRVAVFVNHAGNGSVNRAACSGTPALLMPTGRDQFQVARGATAAGFAITLQPDERDQMHISDGLDLLLNDPAYRAAGQALAEQALAYDAPRHSADHIEALAR